MTFWYFFFRRWRPVRGQRGDGGRRRHRARSRRGRKLFRTEIEPGSSQSRHRLLRQPPLRVGRGRVALPKRLPSPGLRGHGFHVLHEADQRAGHLRQGAWPSGSCRLGQPVGEDDERFASRRQTQEDGFLENADRVCFDSVRDAHGRYQVKLISI